LQRSSLLTSLWALASLGLASCTSGDDGPGTEQGDGSGGDNSGAVGGTVGSGGQHLGSGGAALSSGGAAATGGAVASGGAQLNTGGVPFGSGGRGSGGSVSSGGGATTCTPDPNCKPNPPDTGDFHEDCVARVNQFRACICLPPLTRHTEGEDCASQQAQYDYENDTFHGGIRAKICSPPALNNAAQNECPDYPSVTSTIGLCHQQMFDEGECDDFEVCGHYINMMDERTESVSCGYYETPSGNVWMVENFY
ncbi:MAG TPA: CAP domain-containing protein, partial [Polyangiaceae bacterium]|nr:CAP domain-containing protein [Polyangiaceae bacterium]